MSSRPHKINLASVISAFCLVLLLLYTLLPNPPYPAPPPDALESNEPADKEDVNRRAYFTNYSREEVMQYYSSQFNRSSFFPLPLPAYRLNYPPEDAQTIIRDQTRSTFLEEIVHPMRESLYINGFEPKDEKDTVLISGRIWRQKIIVKYVTSSAPLRSIIAAAGLVLFFLLVNEWKGIILSIFVKKK